MLKLKQLIIKLNAITVNVEYINERVFKTTKTSSKLDRAQSNRVVVRGANAPKSFTGSLITSATSRRTLAKLNTPLPYSSLDAFIYLRFVRSI